MQKPRNAPLVVIPSHNYLFILDGEPREEIIELNVAGFYGPHKTVMSSNANALCPFNWNDDSEYLGPRLYSIQSAMP